MAKKYSGNSKFQSVSSEILGEEFHTLHNAPTEINQTTSLGHPAPFDRYPFSSICLLRITDGFGRKFQGTGFFVSRNCILTAGHNVFSYKRWVKEVIVIKDANDEKGIRLPSIRWYALKGWVSNGDSNFDLGCIILHDHDENINSISCSSSTASRVIVSGYPVSKGAVQWQKEGRITRKSQYRFEYDIGTSSGFSGSPVFSQNFGGEYIACAVNTFGGGLRSIGIRFTKRFIQEIEEWKNLNNN